MVSEGADIGLKCLKCKTRVFFAGNVFKRRAKGFVSRSD
jgi:hypothetical protein